MTFIKHAFKIKRGGGGDGKRRHNTDQFILTFPVTATNKTYTRVCTHTHTHTHTHTKPARGAGLWLDVTRDITEFSGYIATFGVAHHTQAHVRTV